jgi:transposase
MVEGRSAQAVTEFLAAMPAHGAKAEAITEVVMDMSPAYIAGVQTHFPNARIVFDLFHIMKLAGEALDAVRKNPRQQGADLTGGLWALRGNEWTRSQEQLELRRKLARARGPPRRVGRRRLAFHPLVAGLGRPLPARTLPQTLPNSQRTLPRHLGLSGNPPD